MKTPLKIKEDVPQWAITLANHYLAELIVGVFLLIVSGWIGYEVGLGRGTQEGEQIGRDIGYKDGVLKANSAITPELIKQRVEAQYPQELSAREAIGENRGYERGRASAVDSCALERYFSIFVQRIRDGAAAADKGATSDAIQIGQSLIFTKEQGRTALGSIADEALDGLVDQLQGALQRKDDKAVLEILKQMRNTIETRTITANRAMDRLRYVK